MRIKLIKSDCKGKRKKNIVKKGKERLRIMKRLEVEIKLMKEEGRKDEGKRWWGEIKIGWKKEGKWEEMLRRKGDGWNKKVMGVIGKVKEMLRKIMKGGNIKNIKRKRRDDMGYEWKKRILNKVRKGSEKREDIGIGKLMYEEIEKGEKKIMRRKRIIGEEKNESGVKYRKIIEEFLKIRF